MLKLIICFVIANIGKKQSHLVNNSEKLCIFAAFNMYEHSHYKTTA